MAYVPPHKRTALPGAATTGLPDPCEVGGGCNCGKITTYDVFQGWEHTLALDRVRPGGSLLGSLEQYCGAFWHIEATPEAGLGKMCLHSAGCARKTVVLVARLQLAAVAGPGAWEDVYIARYHNCHRRDDTRAHAESFLIADGRMSAAVAGLSSATRRARLLCYSTYQPCHFSGGHSPTHIRTNPFSCTNLFLGYVRDVLAPAHVSLELAIAHVYRAHWLKFPAKYAAPVASAREGISLLTAAAGVTLRAFRQSDWDALAALTDAEAQSALRVPAAPGGAAAALADGATETAAGVAVGGECAANASGGGGGGAAEGRELLSTSATSCAVTPAMRAAREQLDSFHGTTLLELQMATLGPNQPLRCEPCEASQLDQLSSSHDLTD